jgi:hypothetical protein
VGLSRGLKTFTYDGVSNTKDTFSEPIPSDKLCATYGLEIHAEPSCKIYLLCGDVRDLSSKKQPTATAIGPEEINAASIVVLVRHFNKSNSESQSLHMICGDATGVTECFITETYPEIKNLTLLRMAHHGSNTNNSSSEAFLKQMNPERAIISVNGGGNKHSLPDCEVITRIQTLEGEMPWKRRLLPPHPIKANTIAITTKITGSS